VEQATIYHLESDQPAAIRLSQRQLHVLRLVARGMSSQEAADVLFVSKRTVDFHLSQVFSKMQVSNRVQAMRVAWKLGLLPFEPS